MTLRLPFSQRGFTKLRTVAHIIFFLSGGVCAQDAIPSSESFITLSSAVRTALVTHPNIISARASQTAAGSDVTSARWRLAPSFSIEARPLVKSQSSDTRSENENQSIRLSQTLWAGGATFADIDLNKSRKEIADVAYEEARRNLAESVAVAYIGTLYAEEGARRAEEGARALGELKDYVTRRFDAGAMSQADVGIAMARFSGAVVLQDEVRSQLIKQRAELESLLMRPIQKLAPVLVVPPRDLTIEQIEPRCLSSSFLVKRREAEVNEADANRRLKRASFSPVMSVQAERINRRNAAEQGLPESDTLVSVVLQFAPGAGLSSISAYSSASERMDAARAQVGSASLEVKLKCQVIYADLMSSERQLRELYPQLKSLEEISDSFRRQFEAGRKSWIDVLNISKELTETRLQVTRAESLRDQTVVRLIANIGEIFEWLETVSR